jgi:hypothetical protein
MIPMLLDIPIDIPIDIPQSFLVKTPGDAQKTPSELQGSRSPQHPGQILCLEAGHHDLRSRYRPFGTQKLPGKMLRYGEFEFPGNDWVIFLMFGWFFCYSNLMETNVASSTCRFHCIQGAKETSATERMAASKGELFR